MTASFSEDTARELCDGEMKAEPSDLRLLERMRRGETAALGIVLERHSTAVVEYVTTLLGSVDAAEDAAQEAFVRLWERREKWKLEGSLRGLLLRIARNAALDDRRRRLALERAAHRAPPIQPGPTPEHDLEERELRAVVMEALSRLPQRRREVFVLVRQQGMSYREASAILGLSPQTVANHMSLALADLRRALEPHLADR